MSYSLYYLPLLGEQLLEQTRAILVDRDAGWGRFGLCGLALPTRLNEQDGGGLVGLHLVQLLHLV